eukprot:6020161-Pyramimonas_sp.AAC.1
MCIGRRPECMVAGCAVLMSVNFARWLGGRCGTGSTNVRHSSVRRDAVSPWLAARARRVLDGGALGSGLRNV